MANEKVVLRRGPHDSIPQTKVPGTILVETDTGYVFLDDSTEADGRIQLSGKTAIYDTNGKLLADKVDKVEGKGLSTNDFTDAYRNKLEKLKADAQKNVQADWDESKDWEDSYVLNRTHYRELSPVSLISHEQCTGWEAAESDFTIDGVSVKYTYQIETSSAGVMQTDLPAKYSIQFTTPSSEVKAGTTTVVDYTIYQGITMTMPGIKISTTVGNLWILNHNGAGLILASDCTSSPTLEIIQLVIQNATSYHRLNKNYLPDSIQSADSLSTTRYIDGVAFDGKSDITHYAVCDTPANLPVKIVNCPGMKLGVGSRISVKFTQGNTAFSNVALEVNNLEPRFIVYRNSQLTNAQAKTIASNQIVEFVYGGDWWEIVGFLPEAVTPTDFTIDDGSID